MNQAINAYYSITASSEFREMERLRAKARHDEAQALHNAVLAIAGNAMSMGMDVDMITKLTGLTREEVENLQGKLNSPE